MVLSSENLINWVHAWGRGGSRGVYSQIRGRRLDIFRHTADDRSLDGDARGCLVVDAHTEGGGVVRIGPFSSVPTLLRSMGVDPVRVVKSVGLDLGLFDDPDHPIPFVAAGRLLEVCAAQTGCPHFGLLMGQRAGVSSLGLVGALVQHSPTVDAALRSLTLHLHLQNRGGVPTRTVQGDRATLGYAIYQRGMPGSAQVHDATMAIGFNIMRTLCGPTWRPTEVRFAHVQPGDARPYRRFFGAPLRFDTNRTEIGFARHWLDRPLPGSDADLQRFLQEQVAERETSSDDGPVEEVSRALRTMVVAGRGTEERVAALFSIRPRTLHRRLKAQGTTLRKLIDQVRCEIASQLLRDTNITVSEIAATLDYAEVSAFTRAFRRWTETSPNAWRAVNQRAEGAPKSDAGPAPHLPLPRAAARSAP